MKRQPEYQGGMFKSARHAGAMIVWALLSLWIWTLVVWLFIQEGAK